MNATTRAAGVVIPGKTADNRITLPYLLWAGASFGLLSGFVEAIIRMILPWAPPWRIRLGGYLAWMPPIANLLIFLGVAFVLTALLFWKPRWLKPHWFVSVFAALSALNILALWSPPIALLSIVVLAAGLGSVAGHFAKKSFTTTQRLMRGAGIALLSLAVLFAVSIEATRALKLASAKRAANPDAGPNIILIVLDNVGAPNLSVYGYAQNTTPVLSMLARDGVLFERAYSTSSWSLPSHASLMTGRWAHEIEADWKVPLDEGSPTLAEALREHGYLTAGFVSNGAYTQREAGVGRGFAHYEDYPLSMRQLMLSSELARFVSTFADRRIIRQTGPRSLIWHRRSADELHARALRWIDRNRDRSFFIFFNEFDAHVDYYWPADVPQPQANAAAAAPQPYPTRPNAVPDTLIAEYDWAIAGMDRAIGSLLDGLERRGLRDNTLVVITSDHGEEFYEHGIFGHGNTLYRAALEVPLIINYGKRIPAGARVPNAVSNRDVAATVLDLAGVNGHNVSGCSLRAYWDPGSATRIDTVRAFLRKGINTPPEYPVSRGDMSSIIAGDWHLIRNGDGKIELYNTASDPWEQHNLAGDPTASPARARLMAALTDVGPRGCGP